MRLPNRKAPKQATNLSINRDLLNAAREAGVNLSAALEEAFSRRWQLPVVRSGSGRMPKRSRSTTTSSRSMVCFLTGDGVSSAAVFGLKNLMPVIRVEGASESSAHRGARWNIGACLFRDPNLGV